MHRVILGWRSHHHQLWNVGIRHQKSCQLSNGLLLYYSSTWHSTTVEIATQKSYYFLLKQNFPFHFCYSSRSFKSQGDTLLPQCITVSFSRAWNSFIQRTTSLSARMFPKKNPNFARIYWINKRIYWWAVLPLIILKVFQQHIEVWTTHRRCININKNMVLRASKTSFKTCLYNLILNWSMNYSSSSSSAIQTLYPREDVSISTKTWFWELPRKVSKHASTI